MNHLEKPIRQYYEWKGYIVRGNIKVGRLSHGGWKGELDIVAYHPQTQHLIHLEPSLDAHTWEKREQRFQKKFEVGKEYIVKDVFPWLPENAAIEQVAILNTASRAELASARVESVDGFMSRIKQDIIATGKMAKAAIPEEYDLLRTLQLVLCGYYKATVPNLGQ